MILTSQNLNKGVIKMLLTHEELISTLMLIYLLVIC